MNIYRNDSDSGGQVAADSLHNTGLPTTVFLFSLPFIITIYYLVCALFFPSLYIWSTYEDLYGEWVQTFAFLFAFIFSLLILLTYKKDQYRLFFLLLAVVSFYTFMEEISWGQRLLSIETPEFFKEHNYQREMNIHNFFTGPVSSWTKDLLKYLISAGLICYGIIFPAALKFNYRPALFLTEKGILPPPAALSPAFLFAAFFEMEFFRFNEAEVAELLIAVSVAYIAFGYWLKLRTESREPGSRNIGYFSGHLLLLLAIALSSVLTTNMLLSDPAQKKRIESRLSNGAERFAKRYQKRDYTRGVIASLEFFNQIKPNNTVILRRLARNYKKTGDRERAKAYTEMALTEGLRRYRNDPDNVSTHISLSKSYHQAGEHGRAKSHAKHALRIAQDDYNAKPKSAHRAYWLAKANEHLKNYRTALRYYRKAYKSKPDRKRYRKAYYKMKRKI